MNEIMPVIWKLFLKHGPGQILPAGGTVTTEMASPWLPSHFFSLQKEIHSLRCPCFLGKMCVTMNVPSRSVFCQFFVSCQDSCEPVIISGVMRITSPGPTSAPGPGGGEVSGSGSQALAAGWMWLDLGNLSQGPVRRVGFLHLSPLCFWPWDLSSRSRALTLGLHPAPTLFGSCGGGGWGGGAGGGTGWGARGEAKSPLLCVPAASHHQHVEAPARTLGSDRGPFLALPLASGMTLPRTEPQFHHLSNGRDVPCLVVGEVCCLENICLVLG